MKFTVLQMVQDILSSLSSDEVNSISDNAESMQVATILKNTYYNIVSRGDFGEHVLLFQLNPSDDSSKPVLMYKPDGIDRIDWIKYYNQDDGAFSDIPSHGVNTDIVPNNSLLTGNVATSKSSAVGTNSLTFNSTPTWIQVGMNATDITHTTAIPNNTTVIEVTNLSVTLSNNIASPGVSLGDIISFSPLNQPVFYEYVTILPVVQFLDMVSTFNPDDDDVVTYNFQGFNLRYKNDKKPQFCTVIQDYNILFDSFQISLEDTLQASKTMCYGQDLPAFVLTDNFTPNLDDKQFPLLIQEAMARAWFELKQMPHQKAEQESKRQWAVAQKTKSVVNKPSYFDSFQNFGRRAWGASWSPYVFKSSRQYDISP